MYGIPDILSRADDDREQKQQTNRPQVVGPIYPIVIRRARQALPTYSSKNGNPGRIENGNKGIWVCDKMHRSAKFQTPPNAVDLL